MMTPTRKNPRRAEQAVLAVLPRNATVSTRDKTADLIVSGHDLEIKWIGEGNLHDARTLLDGRGRPDVVVARRMSPGARAALADAGIGWVDESGAAEIAVGSIVVSRSGRAVVHAEKPTRWTPAVLATSEALLCGIRPTVAATQEATGLSTGSCTNALRILTDLGLLVADAERGRGSARRIADHDVLLNAYASAAEAQPQAAELRVGVSWRDPLEGLAELGGKWTRAKIDWMVTGAAAASLIAPYLTAVTSADVYVGADTIAALAAVARESGLRALEGGRLTLRALPTVTTARLATNIEGIRVAPWPRVFVDLRSSGVRGEEAAEHLREVVRAR
jgi:hypothetical protein